MCLGPQGSSKCDSQACMIWDPDRVSSHSILIDSFPSHLRVLQAVNDSFPEARSSDRADLIRSFEMIRWGKCHAAYGSAPLTGRRQPLPPIKPPANGSPWACWPALNMSPQHGGCVGVSGALGRAPVHAALPEWQVVLPEWQVALPDGRWRCRVADHRGVPLAVPSP